MKPVIQQQPKLLNCEQIVTNFVKIVVVGKASIQFVFNGVFSVKQNWYVLSKKTPQKHYY